MPEITHPVVLMLGDFGHEGLSAKVEAMGFQIVSRRIQSSPSNALRIGLQIEDLRSQDSLASTFVYLPSNSLFRLAGPEFRPATEAVFARLADTKVLVLVYEETLQGKFEFVPWRQADSYLVRDVMSDMTDRELSNDEMFQTQLHGPVDWADRFESRTREVVDLLAWLRAQNIELVPFTKRSDVTLRIFEHLEDVEAAVFLRLYVPFGRYQEDQIDDFLRLFSRYLREVEGQNFTVDSYKSTRGTTYVFKGRGATNSVPEMRGAVDRFDHFMSLAENDPEKAAALISVPTADALFLVEKYSRAHKRLQMELRQEYEHKRLLLRHRFENDLVDGAGGLLSVPGSSGSSILSVAATAGPVTINIGSLAIGENARADTERLLVGNIEYNDEDRAIIREIDKMTDRVRALELRSELERLKDPGTSNDQKRTSAQKLKSFLYKAGAVVGEKTLDAAAQLLVLYLDKLSRGQ